MDKKKLDHLKCTLDENYSWPSLYLFKFIVPNDKKNELLKVIESESVTIKPSSKGKYVSLSFKKLMKSSDEVIKMYVSVSHIKEIISL